MDEIGRESQVILRTAMDGFWVVDTKGRFLEANDAYCRLIGYTREELLRMSIPDIEAAESSEATTAHIATVMQTGADRFVTRHRRKDGEILDVEVSVNYLAERGGRFFVFVRDVTERRRLELQLREMNEGLERRIAQRTAELEIANRSLRDSEARYRAVADSATAAEEGLRLQSTALNAAANAIVITDRNGVIAWVNTSFTVVTGYQPEEAIGRNPRDLLKSGVHDRAFYRKIWDTILAGDTWQGEVVNRRKDGTHYSEKQTITPVKDARGDITHFISIKSDLTEEKRLEAQFLQAQKMESVGRLAGGVAHDFNNLLTVINGTVDLALLEISEGDPLRADLLEIRRAGERAAGLTRQLLAFSRKQIMKPEILNLNGVLEDLRKMLGRLIGEDTELVVVPGPDLGSLKADRGQLEQVIVNLTVNARDAMPNGGALTIEARNADLDELFAESHPSVVPGPHVMLAVSDTGTGMDEATRLRIFEPFFTTKGQGKGTGLGLSTVYGIVKQSGGSIWVYSEVGKGSTFKIYFPRVDGPEAASRPVPPATALRGTETVLVVEDAEALLRLAARILQSFGYIVLTARNGGEALLVLERHPGPVQLMVTDVVMPMMSGRDLADRLRNTRPEMRVLFTSGYTDDAIVHHGVLDEGVAFIVKPYTAADLTQKVREVLDQR